MQMIRSRRHFLASASLAMATGALCPRVSLADEGPPETTTLRLARLPALCVAPVCIADALLRAEGFTDIRYIPDTPFDAAARGELDFAFETAAWVVSHLAAGQPITALVGLHVGCYELFAHEPIRTISDLKGKRVGIPQAPGSSGHLLLATMVAQVGLDPHTDIDWITSPSGDFMEVFAKGEVDAFLGFPPEPQRLRARGIGRVILNTATDKPWSYYFCCTAFSSQDFVRAHPIATKRYLRAVLKTADFCAAEPERAAQRLVEAGFTGRYDYALQTLTEVPLRPLARVRRRGHPAVLRPAAARVGMIQSSPSKILAEGTDWRFLNELSAS